MCTGTLTGGGGERVKVHYEEEEEDEQEEEEEEEEEKEEEEEVVNVYWCTGTHYEEDGDVVSMTCRAPPVPPSAAPESGVTVTTRGGARSVSRAASFDIAGPRRSASDRPLDTRILSCTTGVAVASASGTGASQSARADDTT